MHIYMVQEEKEGVAILKKGMEITYYCMFVCYIHLRLSHVLMTISMMSVGLSNCFGASGSHLGDRDIEFFAGG